MKPESPCTCCVDWHAPAWYCGDEGTFCSERCYHAFFGRINEYLTAAKAGRHYFEWKADRDILNDPVLRREDPCET